MGYNNVDHTDDIESLARFCFNPVAIDIRFVFEQIGVFELYLVVVSLACSVRGLGIGFRNSLRKGVWKSFW